jgi:hypothetical protein
MSKIIKVGIVGSIDRGVFTTIMIERGRIVSLGLALAVGIAATAMAQDADLQRFTLQADAEGGIWVVDGVSGEVARCRAGGEAAPRVIDVDFGVPVPRPRGGAGAEPTCTGWLAVASEPAIRPRVVDAGFDPAGGTFSGQ